MKRLVSIMVVLFILVSAVKLNGGGEKEKTLNVLRVNDHYTYVNINNIKMWISNNGNGSHNPVTQGGGFLWDDGKEAVFADGLIFGGIYNGQVRVNGNTHRQGLIAGKILPGGYSDDPSLEKYRVYKILKGWENLPPGPEKDQYELDYIQWPITDGAPYIDVNGNGVPDEGIDIPEYVGDETAWYVANDMDPSRTLFTYGTFPMGLEFQTTVFAFKDSRYQDMIFKKYLMIHKGVVVIEDMYLAYWADVDLGYAGTDYEGCDTSLTLGYVYKSTNSDPVFGSPPPAIGYDLLQGPVVQGSSNDSAFYMGEIRRGLKNLPMTSFTIYLNPPQVNNWYRDPVMGDSIGSVEFYNYLTGLSYDGSEFFDPHTGIPSKFVVPGDPVAGTGWYSGAGWPNGPAPADVRQVMASGPFTFAPGDTQEVVIGILIAKGTDNINSVAVLKEQDMVLQELYESFFPSITDIKDEKPVKGYNLSQNYPNPFNPSTVITFTLPAREFVKLKVYDILGNEIAVVVNTVLNGGTHNVTFDPSLLKNTLASGIYLYRFEAGNYTAAGKMVYLR